MRTCAFTLAGLLLVGPLAAADRALVVGVDRYRDPRVPETPGCTDDARAMARMVEQRFGFAPGSVKVLLDAAATAAAIEQAFESWLVEGTGPGDRVFFSYAGHGSQLPDDSGDEEDRLDETLAPYDVDPQSGTNEVRDDVFERLIARLSGRRAVLVFDSCHSGTIARGMPKLARFPRGGGARYLPRPDQFRAIAGGRSLAGESWVLADDSGRSLGAAPTGFVDARNVGAPAGVVVVSAAAPTQRAYPIEVGQVLRGALSFSLEQAVRAASPPVGSLAGLLRGRVRELQQTGRLDGEQVPQVEVVSSVRLDDQPLFGGWEQAAAVALHNPASEMRVALRTRDGRNVYRSGQTLAYEVTTSHPGHLYLLVFSGKDVATCIFPNALDRDNRVAAGSVSVPRGRYTFDVQEPFGRDVVVALVSAEPLPLGDEESYTWREVFDRVGLAALQQHLGGAGRSLRGERSPAWQADSLVLETRR